MSVRQAAPSWLDRSRLGPFLLSFFVWTQTACQPAPTTVASCASISDVHQREECRFKLATALLDQPDELGRAIATVDPVESRDLLLLRLAVSDPPRASRLCTQVTTKSTKDKCQQVVGRPHLSTTPRAPQ